MNTVKILTKSGGRGAEHRGKLRENEKFGAVLVGSSVHFR